MAKTKISEFSATPGNNTDIDGINIAEGCAPSGINDAIRELMAQLKDWQAGTSNDPYVVGSSGSLTLSYGTANGVPYLNGSKVLTSGSALTFDGTNLGIGTTTMTQKVSVEGSVGTRNGGHLLSTASNTNAGGLYLDSSGSKAISLRADPDNDASGTYIGFATDGTERARIDSSGNVGIGTSSPVRKLDVRNTSADYQLHLGDSASTTLGYELGRENTGGLFKFYGNQTGATGYIFSGVDGERMRIDTSGNVGIGTSSPSSRLDLAGGTLTTRGGEIRANNSGSAASLSLTGGNAFAGGSGAAISVRGYTAGYNNGGMEFYYGNGTTTIEAARIDSSGNVGVGTSSPTTRLSVVTASTNAGISVNDGTVNTIIYNSTGGVSSIGTTTNHPVDFYANNAARMRLDSSGNLLVGKTTGNYLTNGLQTEGAGISLGVTNNTGSSNFFANKSATGNYFVFFYGGTQVGSIATNGTTAVSYNTTSDYRLKENVQPMTGALARVAALKPCTYTWKSAPDEIGEGFIAHELAEVCPQAVTGEKDAVNEDGSIKPQSIDTSFLVATLTAAIQEQQAIITAQQAALTALTARVTALEAA